MAGVARDLAARLRLPFAVPDPPDHRRRPTAVPGSAPTPLVSVEVVDDDLCPRFTARVLTGIEVRPSPAWVARRLTLAGMRPINNVVDASNYVMLELGQPTHPYDLDQVAGHGLRVRAARHRRDGRRRSTVSNGRWATGPSSPPTTGGTASSATPPTYRVGIGGIMGGAVPRSRTTTSRVLLEAAYFAPDGHRPDDQAPRSAVRGVGPVRAGLRSRGNRPGRPPPVRGARRPPPGRHSAWLRRSSTSGARFPDRVASEVRTNRVNDHPRAAPWTTTPSPATWSRSDSPAGAPGTGVLDVTVPTFRPDTWREIDVIEEVARHHGYGALPRRRPTAPQVGRPHPPPEGTTPGPGRRWPASAPTRRGRRRCWPPTTTAGRASDGGGVEVANPLTPDETVLRRSLLPGMLKALAFNADRRQDDLRLFEIGHVFPPPDAGRVERAFARTGETVIDEREMVAVAFAGTDDDAYSAAGAWLALADALGVDGVDVVQSCDAAHRRPAAACIRRAAAALVVRGRLPARHRDRRGRRGGPRRPRRLRARLRTADGWDGWRSISTCSSTTPTGAAPTVTPISRFPSSDVDLAFVVDDGIRRRRGGRRRCGAPAATCSSRWASSTSTGDRACRRGRAASPTDCDSAPSTTPSPTSRWGSCAGAASKRSSRRTGRLCGPDATRRATPGPSRTGLRGDVRRGHRRVPSETPMASVVTSPAPVMSIPCAAGRHGAAPDHARGGRRRRGRGGRRRAPGDRRGRAPRDRCPVVWASPRTGPCRRRCSRIPLVNEHGQTTSLGAFRGRIVVLTSFLTSCQETCPLTTGAFLDMQRDLKAAGLAREGHLHRGQRRPRARRPRTPGRLRTRHRGDLAAADGDAVEPGGAVAVLRRSTTRRWPRAVRRASTGRRGSPTPTTSTIPTASSSSTRRCTSASSPAPRPTSAVTRCRGPSRTCSTPRVSRTSPIRAATRGRSPRGSQAIGWVAGRTIPPLS